MIDECSGTVLIWTTLTAFQIFACSSFLVYQFKILFSAV